MTTLTPERHPLRTSTERRIASGEVRLTLADGRYIRVVWSGCGEDPERSFVG